MSDSARLGPDAWRNDAGIWVDPADPAFSPLPTPGAPGDDSLPVIYLFSNSHTGDGIAYAMAEDGKVLGSHWCSHWGYMLHDLHDRPDRREACEKHYPDGYRVVVLGPSEVPPADVLRRNRKLAEEADHAVLGSQAEPSKLPAKAMRALHATGRKHGYDHDGIKAVAARLLKWEGDPSTWPSLSTLTPREASWVMNVLSLPPVEVQPDKVAVEVKWLCSLGGHRYLGDRFVTRIEYVARVGGGSVRVWVYADAGDMDKAPVDPTVIPEDWPRPPVGWLDWAVES